MSDCGKSYSEKRAIEAVLNSPRGARLQKLKKSYEAKSKEFSNKAKELDTKIQAMKKALIKTEFQKVAPKIGERYQAISRNGSAIHVVTVTEHTFSDWQEPRVKARSYLKSGMVKGCYDFNLEDWEFVPIPPKEKK